MSKKITLRTETRKSDSLKESMRIAVTFTPTGPDPEPRYDPVAKYVASFRADGSQRLDITWEPGVQFSTYTLHNRRVKLGKQSPRISSPGDAVRLISENNYTWMRPAPHNWTGPWVTSDSVLALNLSGSSQNLVQSGNIAHHPLDDGKAIVAPAGWDLQVYIVGNEVDGPHIPACPHTGYGYRTTGGPCCDASFHLLRPEDLYRPILSTPICWDALPSFSEWVLCQDDHKEIRLRNDEYSHLAYPSEAALREAAVELPFMEAVEAPPMEIPQSSPSPQLTPLSQVLERLTTIEGSIARMRNDVTAAQQMMASMQTQLSTLEKSTSNTRTEASGLSCRIAAVETTAVTLNESFSLNQDHLSLVQEATADVKKLLTGLDGAVSTTNHKVLDLSSRVLAVESNAGDPAVSTIHSRDRLSAVEAACPTNDHVNPAERLAKQTQEQVSLVQQLVVATNNQLLLMKQIPGSAVVGPLTPTQAQAIDPNFGTPAAEKRVERVEKSLDQTQKQLVTVRNTLNVTDRKIPALEAKNGKLESLLKRAHGDLITVQVLLAGLDRRVVMLEAASGDKDIVDDNDREPCFPLTQHSPPTFPSHSIEEPPTS